MAMQAVQHLNRVSPANRFKFKILKRSAGPFQLLSDQSKLQLKIVLGCILQIFLYLDLFLLHLLVKYLPEREQQGMDLTFLALDSIG